MLTLVLFTVNTAPPVFMLTLELVTGNRAASRGLKCTQGTFGGNSILQLGWFPLNTAFGEFLFLTKFLDNLNIASLGIIILEVVLIMVNISL